MEDRFTKTMIARDLKDKLGWTLVDSQCAVDAVFESVANQLEEGNTVDIFGFGKFEVTTRKARQGINPMTKEKIEIPERKAVKFKASKQLKSKVG